MPLQTGSYGGRRLDLAAPFVEYDWKRHGFIAEMVMPSVGVPFKAASFSKLERELFLRQESLKRAAGGAYNRGTYSAVDGSYDCEEYGHEQPLDDARRNFYKSDFDAEFWAVRVAVHKVMLDREIRVAAALFNTGVWTPTSVGTEWNVATANIEGDVNTARNVVRQATGVDPNALIVSKKVANAMVANNTALKEAIKYTRPATWEEKLGLLAAWLGLDFVFAGGGVKNTADEGQAAVIADVWDDEYALIARVAPGTGASLEEPGVARTFVWEEDSPLGEEDAIVVEEYREEQTRSTVYRARHNVDEVVIDPAFAAMLDNIHQ